METLKDLRLHKGFTLNEIANALCMSKANYYKKEKGDISLSLSEAKTLSVLYCMSIERIVYAALNSKLN